MNKIKLLKLTELKRHEQIMESRVLQLMKIIKNKGVFNKPIIVEKNTKIILDGHHRVEAMKKLGYQKIPAELVDYKDIKVKLRHKNLPISLIRELVLLSGSRGSLLPRKTTKHYYPVKHQAFNLSILN